MVFAISPAERALADVAHAAQLSGRHIYSRCMHFLQISAKIEIDTLCKWQMIRIVDRVGCASHIAPPRI